jgi:hypothetical protein
MTVTAVVRTVKACREYRATVYRYGAVLDRYTVMSTDTGWVVIYTAEHSMGMYRLSRFDGMLSPTTVRNFFEDYFFTGGKDE